MKAPRKPKVTAKAAPVVPAALPTANLDVVRDALNEIDLRVTRVRVIAETLNVDFFDAVVSGRPKPDDQAPEIFLIYCDALKHAAADIYQRTEWAFHALAGKSAAGKAGAA